MNKKILIIIFITLLVSTSLLYYFFFYKVKNSTQEEIIYTTDKGVTLQLETPLPNDTVGCEFELKGSITGAWFFEGSFPVQVYVDDTLIYTTVAQTEENWMTEEDISFVSNIVCDGECNGEGKILMMKDNPSGLKENEDMYEIPIIFDSNLCQ